MEHEMSHRQRWRRPAPFAAAAALPYVLLAFAQILASDDSRRRTPPPRTDRVVHPIADAPAHDPRDQTRDADIAPATATQRPLSPRT
jgi:hypothetical protein